MRKAEMVQRIAQELGCTTAKAEAAVEAILAAVKAALQQGEPVTLRGLGTFAVRAKRARLGRQPKTGAAAAIPARRVVASSRANRSSRPSLEPLPPADKPAGRGRRRAEAAVVLPCSGSRAAHP